VIIYAIAAKKISTLLNIAGIHITMKVVILAGGLGTRLSEVTELKPKPMVEIGGKPILWHILKLYASQGFSEFIICLGYKGYVIKEYFANYFLHQSDITIDLGKNSIECHRIHSDPWKITLIDTGMDELTGGRIKKIQKYVGNEPFMLTYGDGVCDINLKELLAFHHRHGKHATVTSIRPKGRFGELNISGKGEVSAFREKPIDGGGWINGGFFVLNGTIFDYIRGNEMWERGPLERLAKDNQLLAFKHAGFWMCMDTMRDKKELEELWSSDKPPWKMWE